MVGSCDDGGWVYFGGDEGCLIYYYRGDDVGGVALVLYCSYRMPDPG